MNRSAPSVEKEAAFMHVFSYEDSNKLLTGSDVLQAASEEIQFALFQSGLSFTNVVCCLENGHIPRPVE